MVEQTINGREEHNENRIIAPSAEEEPVLIARALEMVRPLNNTSIYTFDFISGIRIGQFVRTINDYMLIQVEGSGTVSIPLCWLKSVEEKYIVIQM